MHRVFSKALVISFLALVTALVLFTHTSDLTTSTIIEKDTYILGEKVKIDLEGIDSYRLKIKTPSRTRLKEGGHGTLLFKPEEPGRYLLELEQGDRTETYEFIVLDQGNESSIPGDDKIEPTGPESIRRPQEKETTSVSFRATGEQELKPFAIINKPVRWLKTEVFEGPGQSARVNIPFQASNISVHQVVQNRKTRIAAEIDENKMANTFSRLISFNRNKGSKDLILNNVRGKIEIEYYTDPPEVEEKNLSALEKEVIVSSPSDLHYEDVLVYTSIPESVSQKKHLKVYWEEEDTNLDFIARDTDEDGYLDRVEWIAPHLSEQHFRVILVVAAQHLDDDREFVSDIYEKVRILDDVWTETIPSEHYVRVTFERNLSDENDITIFPRVESGDPIIEVHEKGTSHALAVFSNIESDQYNKVFLTNLEGEQDTFDLKILQGSVIFDHIIDPTALGQCVGIISCVDNNNACNPAATCTEIDADDGSYFGGGLSTKANKLAESVSNFTNSSLVPDNAVNVTNATIYVDMGVDSGLDTCTIQYSTNLTDWITLDPDCSDVTTETTLPFQLPLNETIVENVIVNITGIRAATAGAARDVNIDLINLTIEYELPFDNTPPNVTLVAPGNGSSILDSFDLEFIYNVTDNLNPISNCSIYVDGQAQQTDMSISQDQNQSFFQYMDNGDHLWAVACTDEAGNLGMTDNRSVSVNISVGAFDERFWETSEQDFTDERADIKLNNTRDNSQNTASFTIPSETLQEMTEATSYFMHHNGALIPAGTSVSFSTGFTVTNSQIRLTWKLSVTNSSGEHLLCQNGDDGINGEPANLGTETSANATCISNDVRLLPSDRIRLDINGYNGHGSQSQSITHAWDGSQLSFVDVNVTTEGFITTDLVDPLVDPNVAEGDTFTATCQTSCSIGICRNVDVYIQRNSTTEGWTDIGSTGNLILGTGETNPHHIGNVTRAENTTFTIEGNQQSTDNHIRCVAIGSYDSSTGATETEVTVGAAGAAAPIVNLTSPPNATWVNTQNITLYYNVSDINDNLANSTLILNGLRNITNQSSLVNGLINNFTINLTDGFYFWTVNATDTTNLEGTDTDVLSFYIDTLAPVVDLLSPDNDTMYQTSTVEFNFTVTDFQDTSLVCDLVIDTTIRDDDFTAQNGTITNRTINDIGVGNHIWNVSCLDEASNQGFSEIRNFTIQDVPPNVTLVTPDGTIFNTPNITLEYNASDNNGLTNSSLYLNGILNQSNQSEVFNGLINNFTVLNIAQGFYNWTVNVTDTAGLNATASERSFTVDYTPPNITLNLPLNDSNSNSSDVDFSFNVTDNIDPTLTCDLYVGSVSDLGFPASNGALTTRSLTDLTDGLKLWNVTCTDDASNSFQSETRTINITERPTITLQTENNTFFNTTIFNLSYLPSDNTGFGFCELYIDNSFNQTNQSTIVNGAQSNFSIDGISPGKHDWFVSCVDSFNLRNNSENRTFTVDLDNLNVELIYPPNGSNFFTDTINFSYNATDDLDPLIECDITVNSNTVDSFNATNAALTNRTVTFSEGGLKLWNVTCTDNALNTVTSNTRNFTLAFAPVVNLTSPDIDAYLNSSEVLLEYNATDDNNNIANATLILNGQRNITNQSAIIDSAINNFTITLADGIYTWTVNVTDDTNLEGTDNNTRNFTVDTQAPNVTLNDPSNGAVLDWNNYTINFTPVDSLDSLLTCNVSVNDFNEYENIDVANGSDEIRYNIQQDGNYSIYVQCADNAGNLGFSQTNNFTIEAPPRVTNLDPFNEETLNVQDHSFIYLPEDPIGIVNCTLYIDHSFNASDNTINPNQNNTFPVTGISEGFHNWSVQCVDSGPDFNLGESNLTNFTVDVTPPAITLLDPQNDTNVLRTATFNFTATDNIDPVLDCDLYIDSGLNQSGILVLNGSTNDSVIQGLALGNHDWNVSCTDNGLNVNSSLLFDFNVTLADLFISTDDINFNVSSPVENETVLINASVTNLIDVSVPDITVAFFQGDPDTGGTQINGNRTISSIDPLGKSSASVEWPAALGPTDIFVRVDPPLATNGSIEEWVESNNEANNSIVVGGWQFVFGDIQEQSTYRLADNESLELILWNASNFQDGNIFSTDSEAAVSWTQLQAVSRDSAGTFTGDDFTDIDTLLSMSSFDDSVANIFTDDGSTPRNTSTFIIFTDTINNVPVANSTNNTDFLTGILWDVSDDIGDGEFSQDDTEDLVFVTEIRLNTQGAYGTYDYEIRVPARLREYISVNTREAVFYAELK